MNEFQIISRFFKHQQKLPESVSLGIGDDGAKVTFPTNNCAVNLGSHERSHESLVIVADTLVEQVHFFPEVKPYDLAHKALAVNLSDLSAMGAKPLWFTLCLTLPTSNESWLTSFSEGLFELANEHEIALVGGDTTSGPLSVTIQAMGIAAPGCKMGRHQAKHGDDIWVTGTLGDAALSLKLRTMGRSFPELDVRELDVRLDRPTPRSKFGVAISEYAHAAIDISDGLSQDLNHICTASQLGAQIFLEQIPLSGASLELLNKYFDALKINGNLLSRNTLLRCALTGGDDYELCFTSDIRFRAVIENLGKSYGLPLCRLGTMSDSFFGVKVVDQHGKELGKEVQDLKQGFTHFDE